jgi:hypothetical protein
MGYFKQPLRRRKAAQAKRELLDAGHDVGVWSSVERDFRTSRDQFIRFAIEYSNGTRIGLFQSNLLIEDNNGIPDSMKSALRQSFDWFNRHMRVPRRLPRNAVCWFRASARSHVAQMRTLTEIYRAAGLTVVMQSTATPGRVVYQDEVQIAAVPYRDRDARTKSV